jgi:hypothetical protein
MNPGPHIEPHFYSNSKELMWIADEMLDADWLKKIFAKK